jgi:hypothetical protein
MVVNATDASIYSRHADRTGAAGKFKSGSKPMAKKPIKVKKGKKPTAKHFAKLDQVGLKQAPAEAEVGGKMSAGAFYSCWNCSKVTYAQQGWDFFICPNCGSINWV